MLIRAIDEYNEKGHLIYIENHIGAYVRGRTADEAILKLPEEIRQYCLWAGQPFDGEINLSFVQEKYSSLQICDADSDVIFESECSPLSEDEYAALKALALRSALDFELLYSSIPDKTLSLSPPRKTFYGNVPLTAEEMYTHTKSVNSYYFGEIGITASNKPDIHTCRNEGFSALENTVNYLENTVFDGSYGESWSLRKMLRRFIWHDRIHAKAMYRMAVQLFGSDIINDPFCFGA